MKRIVLTVCLCTIIILISCKAPYFSTANDMRNIYGTVYTNDGKQLNGILVSSLENTLFTKKDYITLREKNSNETQKIYLDNIKNIFVRNEYYEPKLIDMGLLVSKRILFVRRLTPESSKIGLYELRRHTQTSPSSDGVTIDYTYYIAPVGAERMEAQNIEGRHLTPNFEDKMSELVKDCPSLAEKIKRKEPGYFYAQISLITQRKVEIIRNIIEEYNNCK